MQAGHVIAIDQGTTSTRAILFDGEARALATARAEFAQHYPGDGWVEHDPEDIWRDVVATVRKVMAEAGVAADAVAAIGITNQRETTLLWDRATGRPLHGALVWQDRRPAATCTALPCHSSLPQRRNGAGTKRATAPVSAWSTPSSASPLP